ncbi:MAG: hypothetical protein KAQ79_03570, partial [Cyclobacteriaceae bacterium]|nr:hypothetical protein [Cyclobacteriaceae bacterium]
RQKFFAYGKFIVVLYFDPGDRKHNLYFFEQYPDYWKSNASITTEYLQSFPDYFRYYPCIAYMN